MGKLKDKYGGIVVEQKIIVIYLILIVCLISGCGPKVGNENGKGESDNNSEIEMSDNTKSTDFNISYGIEEVKQNDICLQTEEYKAMRIVQQKKKELIIYMM